MKKLPVKKSLYYSKLIHMKACAFVRGFVTALNMVLFLLTIVLFIHAILACFGISIIDGFTFADSAKALFALLTLLVANIQITRHLSKCAMEAILNLRKAFDKEHFRQIQQKLIDKKDPMFISLDIIELNFLGYIEIGSIMLQKGLMTEKDFSNQFGYILQLLCELPQFYQHVSEDKDYYANLLFAIYTECPDSCDLVD